jgi:hypothetical protein
MQPTRADRDWTDDIVKDPDNGGYNNACISCTLLFTGNKRRHVCRACTEAYAARLAAMPEEERNAFLEKSRAELFEWLKKNENTQSHEQHHHQRISDHHSGPQ